MPESFYIDGFIADIVKIHMIKYVYVPCNSCNKEFNDLVECDIQAPLKDFYGFVQMIVVKTILLGLVTQPTIKGKLIESILILGSRFVTT